MELNGITFPDEVDDIVTKNIVDEDYESGFYKLIAEYVLEDDIVLELGTGLGFTSALAAKKAKSVITLDPNPHTVNYIKRLYEINDIENISFINRAVVAFPPNDNKQTPFWLHGGRHGRDFGTASSLIQGNKSYDKHILVDVICIEALLKEYRPTVMIVDIERYEYEIYKNPNWTSGVQVIIIEQHEMDESMIHMAKLEFNLKSKGFRIKRAPRLIASKR